MSALTAVTNQVWLITTGAGWSLVHALWMGTGLWIGLWICLRLLRGRAAWARYALACGALVLLAGIPVRASVATSDSYSGHGSLSDHEAVAFMRDGAPAPAIGPLPGGWSSAELRSAVHARHDEMAPPWMPGGQVVWLSLLLSLAAVVWALIAAVRLVRVGYGWAGAQALVARARPADTRWARLADELRRRQDIPEVRIGVSDEIDVPIQVGWLHPSILVPPVAHEELDEGEIEAILAHELAHVRRGDYAVNLLQSVLEALLFFHPATAWISRRIRDEREYCSDDLARRSIRGTVADYVRTLTKLEQQRGRRAPEMAMAVTDGSLLRRIRRLVELNARTERTRFDVDLVAVAIMTVALWLPWNSIERPIHETTLTVMQLELQQKKDYRAVYLHHGGFGHTRQDDRR